MPNRSSGWGIFHILDQFDDARFAALELQHSGYRTQVVEVKWGKYRNGPRFEVWGRAVSLEVLTPKGYFRRKITPLPAEPPHIVQVAPPRGEEVTHDDPLVFPET